LPLNRAVEADVPQAARGLRRTLGLMMKLRAVIVGMTLFATSASLAGSPVSLKQVRKDVAHLVHAARQLDKLWPWQPAIPDVAIVAADGHAAGPFLVALLADDPDFDEGVDWHVQQQVALALCKIYGVKEGPGHVYMNRAFPKTNMRIKAFWVGKVAVP
jgi:hypothetical protein